MLGYICLIVLGTVDFYIRRLVLWRNKSQATNLKALDQKDAEKIRAKKAEVFHKRNPVSPINNPECRSDRGTAVSSLPLFLCF